MNQVTSMPKAIFLVASPLQVLCGIEAEKFFNIEKSKYLFFSYEDSITKQQLLRMGEKYKLNYSVINKQLIHSNITLIFEYLKHFVWNWEMLKYDYVFLGDPREQVLYALGTSCLKRKGKMVFLDDGNISMLILSKGLNISPKYKFFKRLSNLWTGGKECFFTNYYDIPTIEYNVFPNKFLTFNKKLNNKTISNKIIILGSPVDQLCNYIGINTNEFKSVYANLLHFLKTKYPDSEILYIPHRRDSCTETELISQENGVTIFHIDLPIESYLIEQCETPHVICGFGTSALLTLKLLFPKLYFYNIVFPEGSNKEQIDEYNTISNYYGRKNIINIDFSRELRLR